MRSRPPRHDARQVLPRSVLHCVYARYVTTPAAALVVCSKMRFPSIASVTTGTGGLQWWVAVWLAEPHQEGRRGPVFLTPLTVLLLCCQAPGTDGPAAVAAAAAAATATASYPPAQGSRECGDGGPGGQGHQAAGGRAALGAVCVLMFYAAAHQRATVCVCVFCRRLARTHAQPERCIASAPATHCSAAAGRSLCHEPIDAHTTPPHVVRRHTSAYRGHCGGATGPCSRQEGSVEMRREKERESLCEEQRALGPSLACCCCHLARAAALALLSFSHSLSHSLTHSLSLSFFCTLVSCAPCSSTSLQLAVPFSRDTTSSLLHPVDDSAVAI